MIKFEKKANEDWHVDFVELTIQRKREDGSRWVQKHNSLISVDLLQEVYNKLEVGGFEKAGLSIDNLMEFYTKSHHGYAYHVTLNFKSFNTTAGIDIDMASS